MRKLVLGVVLCFAFGVPVNGAEFLSGAKAASVKHPVKFACHWVTPDRALRLLRYTAVIVDKGSTKEPAVKASRAVMTRAEPVRFERQLSQRISLTVGVAY
jgi:hypothetical protein